jgi:hypothetical protein
MKAQAGGKTEKRDGAKEMEETEMKENSHDKLMRVCAE